MPYWCLVNEKLDKSFFIVYHELFLLTISIERNIASKYSICKIKIHFYIRQTFYTDIEHLFYVTLGSKSSCQFLEMKKTLKSTYYNLLLWYVVLTDSLHYARTCST